MEEKNSVKDFLAEHPRMSGALFTLVLLLSQASPAIAGGSVSEVGP